MRDDLTASCQLGVTFEQLSAWRESLLNSQEAARIEQHLPTNSRGLAAKTIG